MTGAQWIAKTLKDAGVEVCFCFPGGTVSRLLEAIEDAGIRIVVGMNEAGAGHAAQGYWRATGKIPIVVCTSGPGVTNSLTPLADAYYDRDNVLFIFGQVASDQMGRGTRQDGFQWTDTMALVHPISTSSVEVERMDRLMIVWPHNGPAVLSMPSDLLAAQP